MAGTNDGFDADVFREGIRFAQEMAAPPLESEQVAFYRPTQLVYNVPVDDDNVPFDPDATVTRVTPAPVRVACSVEFQDAAGHATVFGDIAATRVVVTLLDEEYEQVKDATYIVLGGEKWVYSRTRPPSGLFDVGLYSIVFIAENDR